MPSMSALEPHFYWLFMVGLGLLVLVLLLAIWQAVKVSKLGKVFAEATFNQQILSKLDEVERRLQSQSQGLLAHVSESLHSDREKQLRTLAEQQIAIEKKFAETSTNLSDKLARFQLELADKFENLSRNTSHSLQEGRRQQVEAFAQFSEQLSQRSEQQHLQLRESMQKALSQGLQSLQAELDRSLKRQAELLQQSMGQLTESTDNRLKEISGQVEKRLSEGFEKTTQTFQDVLKRLALIDDAQKKITELSSNVVSLQEVLNDKRSRGAFGEVQLQSLVSNIIPEKHYKMQAQLSNGKRVDCLLTLPEPTGNIAIDAKFPLESYRRMNDISLAETERQKAAKQFGEDVKKHIKDIANKYIVPGETADGAVMFIPAESVFAEIHGHYPQIVELAYQQKVWLVSPTTLMAILTTAAAVIKDELTRKQVHIIKDHLGHLGKDFERFQKRMDNLSKHIKQANKDVDEVCTSARKLTSRFEKIEKVELKDEAGQLPGDQPIKSAGVLTDS